MKANVTQDEAGIQWEIQDDGSAEYKKAADAVRAANDRERRFYEALREMSQKDVCK